MKILTSLAGGLAGALSVTLLHALTSKKIDGTQQLQSKALAGDIIGNTLYYSLAGAKMNKAMTTGGLLGLSAGIGALQLPGGHGLNRHHSDASPRQRWLTIGLYIAGGLIAAGVTRWLDNKATHRASIAPAYSPQESYKPVLDITV